MAGSCNAELGDSMVWPDLDRFEKQSVDDAKMAGVNFNSEDYDEAEVILPGLNNRDANFAKHLKEVVDSGKIPDSRGPISQRMARELTDAEKQELKGMNNQQKNDFRKSWAAKKLTVFTERQVLEKTWKKIDVTKGVYMSASKVFQEEGGIAHDVIAAKNILNKCIQMGFPYCKYNSWTERYDYLYMRHEYKETLAKSWSLFQESSGQPQREGADVSASVTVKKRERSDQVPSTPQKDKGRNTRKKIRRCLRNIGRSTTNSCNM